MEVHQTRNNPKCATVVVMDMSGSMRYEGQYIHVKRMALALQGLITSEYPGDFLRFIEMATFAKLKTSGEIIELMPKPVTIHDPWVRLKCDMSREEMQESMVHPHFTNIQHALRLARQNLSSVDTPNKQIIVITDGLPTAHFEDQWLYMLYPPDPRTEEATLLEPVPDPQPLPVGRGYPIRLPPCRNHQGTRLLQLGRRPRPLRRLGLRRSQTRDPPLTKRSPKVRGCP
jgi:uncharacterized protein with von Willebrand factor type A (vWA) domain